MSSRIALSLLFLPLCFVNSSAATIVVDLNGGGDFLTIAEAIAAASDRDTILVAPGTYAGPMNRGLGFGGKNLVLASTAGPQETVIDCEGADRGFHLQGGEDASSQIRGLTITNGSAGRGGGMRCDRSSPTLTEMVFAGNSASEAGGGLYLCESSSRLTSVVFSGNFGGVSGFGNGGGGMQCNRSSASLEDVDFVGNTATSGGGLYCIDGSDPTVISCSFVGNEAASYHGGGVFCYNGCSPKFERCLFEANRAERKGGGIHCEMSSPRLKHCLLVGNSTTATGSSFGGGAVHCFNNAPALIENCTLSGNSASRGSGIYCGDSWPGPVITNSIVVDGVGGAALHTSGPPPAPEFTCCDLFGNEGGDWTGYIAVQCSTAGNISEDPMFCGDAVPERPYALDALSPCAPAANPGCGLVGAFDVACGAVPSQRESWGSIKALFR